MILQPSQMGLSQMNPTQPAPTTPNTPSNSILQPGQMGQQMGQQPQPVTQVTPAAPNAPAPQGPQLSNTGSFLGNLGNSIGNFASNIGSAIMHPINTVTNVGKAIIGGGENLASEVTTGKTAAQNGKGDQFTAVADNIGNYIKTRYGSLDAAKQTAYQDPVGFLADASAILSGGGEAISAVGDASDAAKAAELASQSDFVSGPEGMMAGNSPEATAAIKTPGAISQVGSTVAKVGDAINPVNIAGQALGSVIKPVANGVGNVVSHALGVTTGAGATSIKAVFNAAMDGDSQAMDAVRGKIGADAITDTAQTAYDNLTAQKNSDYAAQLKKIKGNTEAVDISPVVSKFNELLDSNGIKPTKDGLNFDNARGFQSSGEQAVLQNMYDKLNPDEPVAHTLYSADTLKQQMSDLYNQSGNKSGALIATAKNTLSGILKQNEDYKALVEPYETTANQLKEFKSELLGKNGINGTALRKLTKAISQDNEYRTSLIQELNKTAPSGTDLERQLGGLNMSSWTNKSKLSSMLEVAPVILHPSLYPSLLASSPRLVAEFMNALGYTAKQADAGVDLLKQIKPATTLNAAGRSNAISSPGPSRRPKTIRISRPQTIQKA